MPILPSAPPRVKVAAKANARNVQTRRTLREALKAFSRAVDGGKAADIAKAQKDAVSALDVAVKKDVLHRNKAARQKAQLAARAKAAGAKPSSELSRSVAKATAGGAARKATTGKPVKAATKKPTAKKSATKKTTPKKA